MCITLSVWGRYHLTWSIYWPYNEVHDSLYNHSQHSNGCQEFCLDKKVRDLYIMPSKITLTSIVFSYKLVVHSQGSRFALACLQSVKWKKKGKNMCWLIMPTFSYCKFWIYCVDILNKLLYCKFCVTSNQNFHEKKNLFLFPINSWWLAF